jgi:hypothetical protein
MYAGYVSFVAFWLRCSCFHVLVTHSRTIKPIRLSACFPCAYPVVQRALFVVTYSYILQKSYGCCDCETLLDFLAHGNGCLSIKNGSWSAHVSTAERLSFGERKKKSNFRFADSAHIHSPSKKIKL